ncbi:peptidoglycan editing factor PgeF [Coralloluteibacterium stylophorae]|uniref:Purine nucleoside phosphorylase n=1 Tax=Coralloluteibacterium stylophorae TaxID=1776034 RepID=A0A8J8AXP0_9GAMM|nr:peptidoglycan editing factor PgeF [Coralloluteibacterium stylophorae]MBS7456816.1 peptidoglycan editing factor PgeF [Coralloluteibacterium stylophorae]
MHPALLPVSWPASPRVRAVATLRHGAGCSAAPFDTFNLGGRLGPDGDFADAVDANRAQLASLLALPSEPCWLRQVHGSDVLRFDAPPTAAPEADAAVTDVPGVVLAILTADCLPVLFCADDGSEIGAAHAGWRGLAAGVLERTLATLGTPPGRVVAWLGPSAGATHYEVGVEVRDAMLAADPGAGEAFAATRPGHWLCDLDALARRRLARAGVTRVHGGGLSTIGDPQRFFSHRRDGRSGRMASLVWLAP